MNITLRDLAVAAGAFALAGVLVTQTPSKVERKIPPRVLTGPSPKLSAAQKTAAALTQLRLNGPKPGIRALTEVSPQVPYVKDLARLSVYNAVEMHTEQYGGKGMVFGIGQDDDLPPYNLGLQVDVHFQVAKAGKVHVVTFYIDSNRDQQLNFGGQKLRVVQGKQAVPFAMNTTQAGWRTLRLWSEGGGGFTFYRAEIDVLD